MQRKQQPIGKLWARYLKNRDVKTRNEFQTLRKIQQKMVEGLLAEARFRYDIEQCQDCLNELG